MVNAIKKYFVVSVTANLVAIIVVLVVMSASHHNQALSVSDTSLPLINRSVVVNLGKHHIINFKPLKDEFITIQKRYSQKTYIYFNYMNSSTWVGLNERDYFSAASTVKVPMAMSLLRAVEEGKLKLTDTYSLEDLDLDQSFGDLYKVGPDKEFTLQELLQIMLEKSDDTAARAIFNIFKKLGIEDPLANVYAFMGWDHLDPALVASGGSGYQEMNLKTLSAMFLALYDASYINPQDSQMILGYLDNSPFNDKIVAGIPSDIPVSHKIGILAPSKTFTDCGIIYAPNRNYLLCVGSNGAEESVANNFIREISKTAYDYVINH
jgi:beta-lactamase class A